MKKIQSVLLGIFFLIAAYIIWQWQELRRFRVTHYDLSNEKLTEPHRFAVLADVHLWQYGPHNQRLVEAIRAEKPDVILMPGDLIVSTHPEHFSKAFDLMEQLVKIAPVYFSNGNHESRLEQPTHKNYAAYQQLKQQLTALGVHFLNNASESLSLGGDTITISGLELPLSYYKKGEEKPLRKRRIKKLLGRADRTHYQILLAHTPTYIPIYFSWGTDLCLSGHYHGGLVCIPGIGSVISPQFQLFPTYSFGRFDEGSKSALVSRGLGTHTFHVRVFNRAEVLIVDAGPKRS